MRVKHQWMTISKRTLMEGSVITSLIIYERNWSTSYQRETLWTRRLLDCYILILKVDIYQNEFSTYLLREPINSVIQYLYRQKKNFVWNFQHSRILGVVGCLRFLSFVFLWERIAMPAPIYTKSIIFSKTLNSFHYIVVNTFMLSLCHNKIQTKNYFWLS